MRKVTALGSVTLNQQNSRHTQYQKYKLRYGLDKQLKALWKSNKTPDFKQKC